MTRELTTGSGLPAASLLTTSSQLTVQSNAEPSSIPSVEHRPTSEACVQHVGGITASAKDTPVGQWVNRYYCFLDADEPIKLPVRTADDGMAIEALLPDKSVVPIERINSIGNLDFYGRLNEWRIGEGSPARMKSGVTDGDSFTVDTNRQPNFTSIARRLASCILQARSLTSRPQRKVCSNYLPT